MEELEEQRLIRKYLLGALSDQEQQQVEERLLTDQQYKERVLMSEDELVEDYAVGSLSESERERFDSHFLSTPAQIEKLRITRALYTYANGNTSVEATTPLEHASPPPFWRRWLIALFSGRPTVAVISVSALLLIGIGTALYLSKWRWQASRQTDERAALEQELILLNSPQDPNTGLPPGLDPATSQVLQAQLTPALNRFSGEMPKLGVPVGASIAQLRMVLTPEQYQSYQATLSTVEGEEKFTVSSVRPRVVDSTRMLFLNIPPRVLTRGDYILKLRGANETGNLTDAGEYPFRVTN